MILDKLCHAKRYEALHPRFHEAFDFLKSADERPDGAYDLGGGMRVTLSMIPTHPAGEKPLEAHRRYIDIQYILSGHSTCGWANTDEVPVTVPYNAEKDAQLMEGARRFVPVGEGMFYILFPEDAHEPHATDGEQVTCRVAVVKVPVEE